MQCCKCAVVVADRMRLSLTNCPDTVGKWYQAFREKRNIVMSVKIKNNLPPIFELNPDVCSAIKTHALADLRMLSVEMMSEDLHNRGCQDKKKTLARTFGVGIMHMRSFVRPLDNLNLPMYLFE